MRVAAAPWLFRLPWFARFDGHALWNLVLLRSARPADNDELMCHVWQMQHRPLRMPLSYLATGYACNAYEAQARDAAAQAATPTSSRR